MKKIVRKNPSALPIRDARNDYVDRKEFLALEKRITRLEKAVFGKKAK